MERCANSLQSKAPLTPRGHEQGQGGAESSSSAAGEPKRRPSWSRGASGSIGSGGTSGGGGISGGGMGTSANIAAFGSPSSGAVLPGSSAVQTSSSSSSMLENAVSNRLLQEAFASLSLTDKCAFARTISSMTAPGPAPAAARQQHPAAEAPFSLSGDGVEMDGSGDLMVSALAAMEEDGGRAGYSAAYPSMFDQRSPAHNDLMSESFFEDGVSSNNVSSFSVEEALHAQADSPSRASDIDIDASFDMRSVLSDMDKENLGVVMSMMGERELQQVESEVRIIQNNVRGWLLRKNFLNLRSAAKKIMSAWRERSKRLTPTSASGRLSGVGGSVGGPVGVGVGALPSIQESAIEHMDLDHGDDQMDQMESLLHSGGLMVPLSGLGGLSGDGMGNLFAGVAASAGMAGMGSAMSAANMAVDMGFGEGGRCGVDGDPEDDSIAQIDEAASKLQAVTRGVIARKSFAALKRQAVASIVIQKSLMQWWVHSKDSGAKLGSNGV
jgi:hypothetical protein